MIEINRYSIQQIYKMAEGPGKTEEERCRHSIDMVAKAMERLGYRRRTARSTPVVNESWSYQLEIAKSLHTGSIKLLVQGSFANRTNIKRESDVDVAVIDQSNILHLTRFQGQNDTDYFLARLFKESIGEALDDEFGSDRVHRHNKCFKIDGNYYHQDTDVIAAARCKSFLTYSSPAPIPGEGYEGIFVITDDHTKLVNYPVQCIENEVGKHRATNHLYKKCVRVLKNIKADMEESGLPMPRSVSSFGLESLLYNVPNNCYNKSSLVLYSFIEVMDYLCTRTSLTNYFESNGIKPLFGRERSESDYREFLRMFKQYCH